jgi:hypothetical protein
MLVPALDRSRRRLAPAPAFSKERLSTERRGRIGRSGFVEWVVPRRQPVVTGAAPAAWTTRAFAAGRVIEPHTGQISAARLQQLMSGLPPHHGPCAP